MQASETEILRVMKVAILLVGAMATVMALTISSIYGLWYLCSDLVYVILFPQLICVVYFKRSNTYGSLAGYLVGFILRALGGEPILGLPAAIKYVWYEHDGMENTQFFPHRTLAMLLSLGTLVSVSLLSDYLFKNNKLPKSFDIFQCIVNIPHDRLALKDVSMAASSDTLAMNLTKVKYENGAINPLLITATNGGEGILSTRPMTADETEVVMERLPLNPTPPSTRNRPAAHHYSATEQE